MGRYWTGKDLSRHDSTRQEDWTGQDRTGQDGTGQDKRGQSRTKFDSTRLKTRRQDLIGLGRSHKNRMERDGTEKSYTGLHW